MTYFGAGGGCLCLGVVVRDDSSDFDSCVVAVIGHVWDVGFVAYAPAVAEGIDTFSEVRSALM